MSLRTKLFLGFVLVVLLTGIMATSVGLHLIGSRIYSEMQSKVAFDLNSTREFYDQALRDVRNAVRHGAGRRLAPELLAGRNLRYAGREFERIMETESLDILAIVDPRARLVRCGGLSSCQGPALSDPFIASEAMRRNDAVFGTMILPKGDLSRLGPGLAERAHIKLIPTLKARETRAVEETSGMALAAAAPVRDGSGRVIGVLFGAKLLNRSPVIVDKATAILYGERQYRGRNIGTVTIFQNDLRVATTVRDREGSRVIGTRGSEKVCDAVLGQGKSWIDRAFVVSDWYITAYEPIRDLRGRIVGMLYVGVLEAPYAALRREVFLLFVGISFLGVVLALGISYVISGRILGPVQKLMVASGHLGKGDLDYRVDIRAPDEFGELGRTFNLMADSIRERDEQIKLQAQEMVKGTERLATIGRLAAGVAHEINNPLGGILVYTHLLLEDTPAADPRRANLEKVARETERVRRIVRGLLEFARETESRVEEGDLQEAVLKTLDLVDKQILFENIKLVKDFAGGLPHIPMDKDKIRQTLLNIVMNAAESMEGRGGTLTVATRAHPEAGTVEVEVSDTGCGIPPENLKRIFEPFFTTKEVGKGTGLGLAISYGIVKQHGGSIEVESSPGKGTTMRIILPVRAPEPA